MRSIVVIGCGAALIACTAAPAVDTPSPTGHGAVRAAAPTTRLVMPSARDRPDADCADFPDQAAAQKELRARPSDPDRLDADDDGLACERLFRPSLGGTPRSGPGARPRRCGASVCAPGDD
ncbi:MAG: hypothetical protein HYY42_07475 [Chloroflexi bacterium]|nr:hypothetical protein [Chloroflexota bacterium]